MVTLTRIAPSRGLDDDGLCGALKGVRDQVAAWLGVDDRHRHIVRYLYEQERGPWAVRIEWRTMEVSCAAGLVCTSLAVLLVVCPGSAQAPRGSFLDSTHARPTIGRKVVWQAVAPGCDRAADAWDYERRAVGTSGREPAIPNRNSGRQAIKRLRRDLHK